MIATLTAAGGNSFRCIVIADSGADQCVFPVSFAIALGLDPLHMLQQLTGGVGNIVNVTFYGNFTIAIANGLSFSAYAVITSVLESQGGILLGQKGYFENHVVTFDEKNKRIHIE